MTSSAPKRREHASDRGRHRIRHPALRPGDHTKIGHTGGANTSERVAEDHWLRLQFNHRDRLRAFAIPYGANRRLSLAAYRISPVNERYRDFSPIEMIAQQLAARITPVCRLYIQVEVVSRIPNSKNRRRFVVAHILTGDV